MDAANRALCYFYRHPPPDSGVRPSSFEKITYMVVKQDGVRPSVGGVFRKLIGSMAARLQQCKDRQGAMTKF